MRQVSSVFNPDKSGQKEAGGFLSVRKLIPLKVKAYIPGGEGIKSIPRADRCGNLGQLT
ncbi:MAG: hypothetical protein QNJ08_03350 [Crocosphaera sp.]|nr:hypothetical protein [Crocosphaera sp.]